MNQGDNGNQSLTSQIRSGLGLNNISMTDGEMLAICRLMKKYTGITLPINAKRLVLSRLIKRIQYHQLSRVSDYVELLQQDNHPDERSFFVDALTTNETYFFREPAHFEFLARTILPKAFKYTKHFRVWSAASSEGQEAYSIAFTLESVIGHLSWEVVGTDINRQVVAVARKGVYPLERMEHFPTDYLKRYCLKGNGSMTGYMAIGNNIKDKVSFENVNLDSSIPTTLGDFDVIFLRNILIYFDKAHQLKILNNVLSRLKPHGTLFIGTSEHIDPKPYGLRQIKKSIFMR